MLCLSPESTQGGWRPGVPDQEILCCVGLICLAEVMRPRGLGPEYLLLLNLSPRVTKKV